MKKTAPKSPYGNPSEVNVSRTVRELCEANAVLAQVANLWVCGYTVASIQREVPQIARERVTDIINLLAEVSADLRRAQP